MKDDQQTQTEKLQAIGRDLEQCEIGIAFTSGKLRQKYIRQRAKCMAEIKRMNEADGLNDLTDEQLLKALADQRPAVST